MQALQEGSYSHGLVLYTHVQVHVLPGYSILALSSQPPTTHCGPNTFTGTAGLLATGGGEADSGKILNVPCTDIGSHPISLDIICTITDVCVQRPPKATQNICMYMSTCTVYIITHTSLPINKMLCTHKYTSSSTATTCVSYVQPLIITSLSGCSSRLGPSGHLEKAKQSKST